MKLESFIAVLESVNANDHRFSFAHDPLATGHAILIFKDRFGSCSDAIAALKRILECPEPMSERADNLTSVNIDEQFRNLLAKLTTALHGANSAIAQTPATDFDAHAAIGHLIDAVLQLKAMMLIIPRRALIPGPPNPPKPPFPREVA